MWCVLVIERRTHNRWNHTSHNGDVGNNIDVLNIWNCLNSEDTNWRWHPVYIELRFSFTAGLVFNMSIHWAHGLPFHVCIQSPWFNCAFVSILPFIFCCVNLLADSFHFHFPICLMKSLTVQYCMCDRTERGATATSKMALVRFSLSQESLLPTVDDGSHTQCITNLLKSESYSQSKEVWSFCELTNDLSLSLSLSLFSHRFVPHHRIKWIWDLDQ